MSLIDKIEKLNKKPESYRKKILFISVAIIMFLIIFARFFVFNSNFDSKNEVANSAYGPIEIIKKDVVSIGSSLGGSLTKIKNLFKEIETEYEK